MNVDRKAGRKRRVRLPNSEEGIFKNHTKLDDYLELNYEMYIGVAIDAHANLEKAFGGRPDITTVIKDVELSLYRFDRGLYDYLDKQTYAVNDPDKYREGINLFTRVIVSEALPKIFKNR